MMKDEKKVKSLIVVLWFGAISVIVAMIWANGKYQKEGLLQLGNIYDIPQEALTVISEGASYDYETGEFSFQEDTIELYVDVNSDVSNWNYCTVKVKERKYLTLYLQISFMDEHQNVLFTNSLALGKGKNTFKTPIKGIVKSIKLTIYNSSKEAFGVEEIQLRQKFFDIEDFLQKTVVIFLICVACYILVWAKKSLDWYLIIEVIQNFFILIGNSLGRRISSISCQKKRQKLQTACFTLLFLLSIAMNVTSGNDYSVSGQYWMLGFGILLLFIGVLSVQRPLHKQNWRTGACLLGVALWGVTMFSDLFISKNVPYVGYMMALCGGFVIFAWQNGEGFQNAFYRLLRGLEWTLPFIVVYCMFFRSKKMGILYNGCFPQRESMSMYALALLIAFLADGRTFICQKKFHWRKLFVSGVGASFSVFFLYYSDTLWCNLAAFAIVVIWIVELLYYRSLWKDKVKKLIVTGVVMLLYALVLIIGVKYLIKELPGSLGTDIIYDNEVQETKLTDEEINAIETEWPGWMTMVTRESNKERKELWRLYVQKLNLIGNQDNIQEEQNYVNPSNGLMQVAYKYGMFILAPYLGFLILSFCGIWKQREFLCTAIVLSFVAGIIFEDLEIPYAQPLWFMFYLGMGQFISEEKA